MNVSKLPIPDKLVKGQDIITKSTANPNVPGNTATLAAFSAAQAALTAANAAYEANRQAATMLMTERDNALEAWLVKLTLLAAFTESATDGLAEKIQSAGFAVRSEATPPQPVGQVQNVRVGYNGSPGYSDVRWDRDPNADAYMVQCSPDPITETSWKNMGTVTRARFEGNGATPGQRCWYRIAAVNALGEGPWSEPALRPVM
ncbi:MAG: fibronectin type III domain-containing protein [Chthoniobacteraceae bacterium]